MSLTFFQGLSPQVIDRSNTLQLLSLLPILLCIYFVFNASKIEASVIEGIVFTEHGPAPGATVFAYSSYENLVANHIFSRSVNEDKPGQYKLDLPPGSYYLVAHAELDHQKFISYHGVNPITVSDEYRWLPFLLVEETTATCIPAQKQGISGRVSYKGEPISGGVVSVYPWQDGKFRGMGLLTNTLENDGSFHFGLEPGTYVVIARKKQDIRGIGPVRQGDMFCYPSSNPLRVESGQQCTVQINCYPRDNLNLFLDENAKNPQGRKHDTRRQASFYDLRPAETPNKGSDNTTRISGRVTDPAGNPRPDLTITAYPANGLNLFQMHVVRLITNTMARSDQEGKFTMDLKDGGTYYIIAREKVGEAPDRGEYYGIYEGSANHSITINRGESLNGIDVVVDRIMPKTSKR